MWTPLAHFCDRSILITGSAMSPAEILRIRLGNVSGEKKSRQTSSIGMMARAPYCAIRRYTVFIVDAFLDRVENCQKEERRAGPLSASVAATQLLAFLDGGRAACVDPLREIFDMYALGRFLGSFDAHER